MRLRKIDPTRIPALLANGLSAAEIADAFGCTEGSLRVRCSQLKIGLRRVSPEEVLQHRSKPSRASGPVGVQASFSASAVLRHKRRSKIDPRQIPLLLERGFTSAEIAAEFGCTLGTLRVRCSRLKISLRQPRKVSGSMLSQGQMPSVPVSPPRLAASGKSALHSGSDFLDVVLPTSTIGELRQRAAAMGLSAGALAASLLETISKDCLYSAVLDAD